MEIEFPEDFDKETMQCIKDQIFFDDKGIGINYDELMIMFLCDIFGIN